MTALRKLQPAIEAILAEHPNEDDAATTATSAASVITQSARPKRVIFVASSGDFDKKITC